MLLTIIPNLQSNLLFSDIPENYINEKFNNDSVIIKEFEANTIAYSSQTEPIYVGIIISGSVRVYSGWREEKALLNTLHSGNIFGIANLYDENEPFPSQIITVSNTKIAFIRGDTFKDFIENNDIAMKNYLRFLTKKIIYLNKKITTFTAGSSEKKLALFISEHTNENTFIPPCSISELSSILGIGRASLYRAIDILKENNIIEARKKNTFTVNIENLKKYI